MNQSTGGDASRPQGASPQGWAGLLADPGGFDSWAGARVSGSAGIEPEAVAEILDGLFTLLLRLEAAGDTAGLERLHRGARRFVLAHPGLSVGWAALIRLEGRALSPDRSLTGLANRAALCRGLLNRPAAPRDCFRLCVLAKATTLRGSHDRELVAISAAMGLENLVRHSRRPAALAAEGDWVGLRLGSERVRWRAGTPELQFFLMNLFLFEPGMWRWFSDFGPEDVLVDIGANIGLYSLGAACLFGARTFAIEPFPTNVAELQANIDGNRADDRITVLPIAISDVERRDRLYFGPELAGAASQHFGADLSAPDGPVPRRSIEVQGVPLDLLVARGTVPPPSRVKIDVDGNEGAVIAGMRRTLDDPRLKQVRMEIRWWEGEGPDVLKRMEAHGFDHRVDDDRKNLLFFRR